MDMRQQFCRAYEWRMDMRGAEKFRPLPDKLLLPNLDTPGARL
jgi:hypothetical protein